MGGPKGQPGVFTSQRVGRVVRLAVIVQPGRDVHQIGNVGRNAAFQHGRIAPYDVFVTDFALVRLQHHYTWIGRDFLKIYQNQIPDEWSNDFRRAAESCQKMNTVCNEIPDEWVSRLASSPRSSDIVHEATKTKSVTNDGMVHLSMAALPRMTCSLLTSTT